MKKYKILLSAAISALMLASCAKENGVEAEECGAITIEASIGDPTKVAYNGDKASFIAGDKVSVYVWMGSAAEVPQKKVVNGVVNTFDGNQWKPDTQMLWSYKKENHYFLGVYPPKAITNFTADAYTLGDDLMIATELNGIPFQEASQPVSLTFTHAMAKLNVNLKFRSQWDTPPTVTSVAITAKDHFTVNYLTKAITATGELKQVPVQALETPVTGYVYSYSGLQVPQSGMNTITVTIAGQGYVFTAPEAFALESGKVTTIGLNVGRENMELGEITVTNWAAGDSVEGGEAVIPVTGVSFKEGTGATVDIGGTLQLTPVFAPEGATGTECVWTSSDESVATVDSNGLVTVKTRGTTDIVCTCGTVNCQFKITGNGLNPVYTPPTAITGLKYNSSAQTLLNAGSVTTEGLVMEYSLNQTSWSTTVPKGTNAGSYKVYWRIPGNATYNDVAGTYVTVSVARADASMTLSTASVSFSDTDDVSSTKTATISTYTGDGTLSVSSSNKNLITASLSGTTITLTRKSSDGGTCTITVSAAAGTNYAATSKTINVSVTSSDPGTYLRNASVAPGYKIGSNGKAYAPGTALPTGVTLIGAVVFKNDYYTAVMKKSDTAEMQMQNLVNYNTSAGNFYLDNLTSTTAMTWVAVQDFQYEMYGVSNSGLSALNTLLTGAGCDAMSETRYYGAKNLSFDYGTYWGKGLNSWYTAEASQQRYLRPVFTFDNN